MADPFSRADLQMESIMDPESDTLSLRITHVPTGCTIKVEGVPAKSSADMLIDALAYLVRLRHMLEQEDAP